MVGSLEVWYAMDGVWMGRSMVITASACVHEIFMSIRNHTASLASIGFDIELLEGFLWADRRTETDYAWQIIGL